jgi:hypothetical protein
MIITPAISRQHFEWNQLIGALVEIRHGGETIRTGFVDDAMPDSSALWIAADSTGTRQMFECRQGHEVWVTPQELAGDLNYRMTTRQIFGKATTGQRG